MMALKEKLIYSIFILTFFLFLTGVSVASVLTEDNATSVQENREMQQMPEFCAEELWDGSWFQSFESYNKDQFPSRPLCMRSYYGLLDFLQVKERNGYVLGKNDAILTVSRTRVTENRIKKAMEFGVEQVETMKILAAAAEEWDGKVIYVNIPHKLEFFSDMYPDHYNVDYEINEYKRTSIIEKARQAGITVVETADVMQEHKDEYIYFLTDNHYTLRGAYYTYLEILNCINELDPSLNLQFPQLEELEHVQNHDRFAGSYLRKWGDSGHLTADYVEYMFPSDMPEYVRYDNGKLSKRHLYKTTQGNYSNFMGGNIGNTVVDTNRDNLPSVLYLGFSYSNALEPLSVYNFNKMESIDPRYWKGSICEYMQQSQPDYIIIVRDDIYAENSSFTCTVE